MRLSWGSESWDEVGGSFFSLLKFYPGSIYRF